jgi:hypothetical protein
VKWRPIYTAPKGTPILLRIDGKATEGTLCEADGETRTEVIHLSSHGCGCCGFEDDPPTHWAPLPELAS